MRRTGSTARGRWPRTRRPAPAFTLAELLIVMFLISTLAVAALPSISATMEHMTATGLAREIATDMRYAQTLAVQNGVRHRVSFWEPGQAYAVRREDGGSWTLCTHPITKREWRVALGEHSRYGGLTLKDSQFGADDYLYWDALGSPQSGGFVTFTLGSTTRTIRVAPLSGKITVQ